MSFRASLKNLIRRDPAASLRERAAGLRASLPQPETAPAAAPSFAEQVGQAGTNLDVLGASGIDHRDGTVSYADATGKVSRRPMARWVAFNAVQMHNHVQAEIGRRRVIEANPLPADEHMAWEARIRRELRADAISALTLYPERAFQAEQDRRSGAEPTTAEGRTETDTELLALAPEWESARNAFAEAIQRQEAITDAAMEDGAPGPAPAGSGSDWRAWFERSQDWRQRTGVDAAEEVSGAACRVLGAIEDRIAALPAASLAGLRLKARVAQRCEDIEVEWPDKLGEGLTRDLLAFTAATDPGSVEAATLATLGRPAGADPVFALIKEHRAAYDEWDRSCLVWREMLSRDPGYAEAMAASDEPGQREVAAFDALFAARPETLQGVVALAEYLREATDRTSPDLVPSVGEQGLATVADALRVVLATREKKTRRETSLVGMLDLASASISELRAVKDIAEHVGAVAYAYTWGPRCGTHDRRYGSVQPNGIGQLMHWLGDALTEVETAANNEAQRRQPSNRIDRETRLFMLAGPIIDNGDPETIEELACELLAHAKVERAGR